PKIVRTCGSNCPEMSLPASSRVAVCPASQMMRPPWVMTAGEYARAAWNSVLSRYSDMTGLLAWLTDQESDIFSVAGSGGGGESTRQVRRWPMRIDVTIEKAIEARRLLVILGCAALSVIGTPAVAQDKGSVNPRPLPPLANPDDPKTPAKQL